MFVRRSRPIPTLAILALAGLSLAAGDAFAQGRSAQETVEHGARVSRPLFGDTNPAARLLNGSQGRQEQQMSGEPRTERSQATRATRMNVTEVQRALNREGANLRVDGVMGPRTREALMDYQARNDLPVSGRADSETRAKLGL